MKKSSILILQAVIVLIGIGALVFLLWEPQLEGRNANATLFEVYFKDPFLAYAYIASISFFAVLYQAFKILKYAGQNRFFSQESAKALRLIKICAMSMIGFVVIGEIFILSNNTDDRPPAIFMGMIVILGALIFIAAARKFERVLKNSPNRNPITS